MSHCAPHRIRILLIGMFVALLVGRAPAATFTWTGAGANDNWTTAANWAGGVAPSGLASDDLVFPASPRLTPANVLAAGTTIGSITFSAGGYTIGGNPFVLAGGLASATGSNAITPAVSLGAPFAIDVAAGALTLTGTLGATAHALSKSGDGRLILNGGSTRSGTTAVAGGVLQLNGAAALGTGVVTVGGGVLASNTANVVANGVILAGGSVAAIGGDRTFSGAVEVTASSAVALADTLAPATARGVVLSGVVTGAAALAVSAPAGSTKTLRLSNPANTFSGDVSLIAPARLEVASGAAFSSRVSGGGAVSFLSTAGQVTTVSGDSVGWSGDASWGSGNTGRASGVGGTTFAQKFRLRISEDDALGSDATIGISGGSGLELAGGAAWGGGGKTVLSGASQRGNVLGAEDGGGRFDGAMVWTESNGSLYALGTTLTLGATAVLDNRLSGSNYQYVTLIGDGTIHFAAGFDADAYEGATVAGNLLGWGSTLRHHEGTVEVQTAGRWWASGYQMANHGSDVAAGRQNPARLRVDVTTAHPSQAAFGKTDAAQTLEVTGGHTWTITAPGLFVVDTGATLVKGGAGTVIVSAAQQHGSGATLDLRDGAAYIDSGGLGANRLAVRLGNATLGGDGEVGAVDATRGVLAPGSLGVIGALDAETVDLSGGLVRVRVAGYASAGADYDRLAVRDALTVDAATRLVVDVAGLTAGGVAVGIATCGSLSGAIDLANVTLENDAVGFTVSLRQHADSIDLSLDLPVPTATRTATWTATPTSTATAIATETAPPTATATPTVTATGTASETAVATATDTATPPPSPTPSATPTASVSACGDGALAAGEACDDGNRSGGDGCDAACGREPCFQCEGAPSVCGAAPHQGCRVPIVGGKSKFALRAAADPAKRKLVWKWTRGAATSGADFGDPRAGDDYDLCLFDRRAGVAQLAGAWRAPAGVEWTATSGGRFGYRDASGATGIRFVKLRPGVDGKARVIVTGKGAGLAMPPLPLANDPSVLVQIGSAGACWESAFSLPIRNDASRFRARSDP